MRLIRLFTVAVSCLFISYTQAQDLKDLRARPDTSIADNKDQNLIVRDFKPVIPKLDLEVNYWKHWTTIGVNMNQASFNEDWQGGGVNSIALGLMANQKSEYNKDNFNFTTQLNLSYGKIRNKGQMPKKNNDRVFWDNKLSYKLSKNWSLYTSLTFESQFDVGYKYKKDKEGIEIIDTVVSAFMAPGYVTESFGLEYKPSKEFSLRLGTGTARQTFVLDNRLKPLSGEQYFARYGKYLNSSDPTIGETRFGVEGGKTFRNELAFQITANLDKNLSQNLNIKSRYNLFASYEKISDPAHRLDMTLTARVSKWVNVNLNGIMIYDSNVLDKIQLSQGLALGLVYSLP